MRSTPSSPARSRRRPRRAGRSPGCRRRTTPHRDSWMPRPPGSASRTGVPDRSPRGCRVRGAQRGEERLALRPVRAEDHDLPGDAVVAAVLQSHRRDVLGVVAQIRVGPLAGNDDDRRNAAELGGDRLVELWGAVLAAARGGRGAGPADGPHTIVSNVGAAPVMCTWSIPGCAVRYAPTSPPPRTIRRKPELDERRECPLEHRHERVLRRVDLEDHRAVGAPAARTARRAPGSR